MIHLTATITFDYDPEDGLVTTPDAAIEDFHDTLATISARDFNFEVVDTEAGPTQRDEVLRLAQAAQDAAEGDSNDAEIDLLREALETALAALGLPLPESEGVITGIPPMPVPQSTGDEHADFHQRSMLPMGDLLCQTCTPQLRERVYTNDPTIVRFGFNDFEPETEGTWDGSGDPDKHILTIIADPGGDNEEVAVIVHRLVGGKFPLDGGVANEKRRVAQVLVDLLNENPGRLY